MNLEVERTFNLLELANVGKQAGSELPANRLDG